MSMYHGGRFAILDLVIEVRCASLQVTTGKHLV